MKINDWAVIETRDHTTDGWVLHRTADGRVWLDTDPDSDDSNCSELSQNEWDEHEPKLEIGGRLIFCDRSGVSQCWRTVRSSDMLPEDLDALYELIVNKGMPEGETTIDLRHYRWG